MKILLNVPLLCLMSLVSGCGDDNENQKEKDVWEGISDPVDRSKSKEFQP